MLFADAGLGVSRSFDFRSESVKWRINVTGYQDDGLDSYATRESDSERAYVPWHVRGHGTRRGFYCVSRTRVDSTRVASAVRRTKLHPMTSSHVRRTICRAERCSCASLHECCSNNETWRWTY